MGQRYELRRLGQVQSVEVQDRDLILGSRTIAFDTIRKVVIGRLGEHEMCSLHLDGGQELTFGTDEASTRAAYADAVRAVWAALASRNVPFVSGAWLLAGTVATITLACGVAGALLFFGVIDAPAHANRGAIVAVLCAIGGPIVAFRSRPKKLSTEAELEAALPRA
jgi:hypothetical protein